MNKVEEFEKLSIFIPEAALSSGVIAFLKKVGASYDQRRSTKGYQLVFNYYTDDSVAVIIDNKIFKYYF